MEAFSHQQQYPFLHDPVLLKNNPNDTTNDTFFSQFYASDDHQIGIHENSYLGHSPSMASSMVDKVEISGENVTLKRKNRDFSSLNSAQSKVAKTGQSKKQRKCNVEEKKVKTDNKKEKRKVDEEEAPLGYIHVRARRGQATDSHSLAERVRRERISERMKLLQALVPGCDKVTGKALMLDEIINYVQSLQNQVEFLSMKLASLNPMIYEFGVDPDAALITRQCSPNETFGDTITTAATFTTPPATNQTCFLDPSILLHGQMLNLLTQDNDVGGLLWDVDGQKSKFMNPSGLINNNNLCSFL